MERVIKFRAWDEDAQRYEWIGACAGFFGGELTPDGSRNIKFEQFTGLHDKNGKEIYEGDVVRMDSFEPSDYIVKFIDGAFCLWNDDVGYGTDIHYTHHAGRKQATVTSNIHERG